MGKKISQQQYIDKVKSIHGNIYDYSKTIYKNMRAEIEYECKIHGCRKQKAGCHLKAGCERCSYEKRGNDKRSNTLEFIEKSSKMQEHIGKYTYQNVNYIDSTTLVNITCLIHGDFQQRPSDHLSGYGCPDCGYILCNKNAGRVYDTLSFIKKSLEIHQDKFLYDKVEYIDNNTKVIITCKIHGDFEQIPYSHLAGRGCWDCASEYKSINSRATTDEFIEKAIKIHGNLYNYENVEYTGSNNEVKIECNECKLIFSQKPLKHLSGHGCTNCINKTEKKLYQKLIEKYKTLKEFRTKWCKSENDNYLPFDFLLEDFNIIIELDGLQHFTQVRNWKDPISQQQNDKYKMKCANDNGFSVIRILQEDVYYDTYDWDTELDINIKKIIEEKQIVNIFICKNNEYNIFQ